MMKKLILATVFATAIMGFSAQAEETTMEKANTKANKTIDSAKDTYDKASHEVCKKINGKMDPECVARNAKNRAKTMKSKVETKAEEIKDKVD